MQKINVKKGRIDMLLVEIKGNRNEEQVVTSSRTIADYFEKRHSDVLRAIEMMGCSPEFTQRNYALSSYKDESGKSNKEYIITKDGFVMLAMGFIGEKAFKFKEDYIRAFNAMQKELERTHEERQQWLIEREKGKLVRHILTDTIKMKVAESPNKKFMYPNYTKLIYKLLFNKTFDELKAQYGIKGKESLRDYLPNEELKELEEMEMLISSLIGLGWGYQQIKDFVSMEYTKKLAG